MSPVQRTSVTLPTITSPTSGVYLRYVRRKQQGNNESTARHCNMSHIRLPGKASGRQHLMCAVCMYIGSRLLARMVLSHLLLTGCTYMSLLMRCTTPHTVAVSRPSSTSAVPWPLQQQDGAARRVLLGSALLHASCLMQSLALCAVELSQQSAAVSPLLEVVWLLCLDRVTHTHKDRVWHRLEKRP